MFGGGTVPKIGITFNHNFGKHPGKLKHPAIHHLLWLNMHFIYINNHLILPLH